LRPDKKKEKLGSPNTGKIRKGPRNNAFWVEKSRRQSKTTEKKGLNLGLFRIKASPKRKRASANGGENGGG